MLHEPDQPWLVDRVEEAPDVGIHDEVHFATGDSHHQRVKRIVLATPRSKTVAEPEEVFFVDTVQDCQGRFLDDLVFQCSNRERPLLSVPFGYHHPPRRLRPVSSPVDPIMQLHQFGLKTLTGGPLPVTGMTLCGE
jgi:hypothetical protein